MTTAPNRIARFALVVVAGATVGSLVVASPAAAAPVAVDSMYLTDWYGQLFSIDPVSGELTAIGPGQAEGVAGLDVDASSGIGFEVNFDESTLLSIDVSTGAVVDLGEIADPLGDPVTLCTALDLTGGVLVANCRLADDTHAVGILDPATVIFTPVILDTPRFAAIARNPVTGKLYGIDYQGEVANLDLATESYSLAGTIPEPFGIYGASFDSSGVLWGVNRDTDELVTIDTTTWQPTIVVELTGEDFDFTEAFSVAKAGPVPAAPQLAATGSTGVAPGLVVAFVLGIAGAVLLRRRSVRSTSA